MAVVSLGATTPLPLWRRGRFALSDEPSIILFDCFSLAALQLGTGEPARPRNFAGCSAVTAILCL